MVVLCTGQTGSRARSQRQGSPRCLSLRVQPSPTTRPPPETEPPGASPAPRAVLTLMHGRQISRPIEGLSEKLGGAAMHTIGKAWLAGAVLVALSAAAGVAQEKKTLAIVVKGLDNPF